MSTNEELSYEDRKKWFRYHMHNSKICEKNAWKQMNEMIRMKIKDNPNGSIKQMIDRIWEENEDIFDRNWLEENRIMFLDYETGKGTIYKHWDDINQYLMEVRYQKLNKVTAETEENNLDNKKWVHKISIQSLVIMDAILKFTGILLKTLTLRYLVRKNIYVLIESTNHHQ